MARFQRDQWWRDRLNLIAVIDFADEVGEFHSIRQVVHFLEKPWIYDDLWTQLRDSLCSQGEQQDEFRAREP